MPRPNQTTLNFFDKLQLGLMRLVIAFLRRLGFRGIRFLSGRLGRLAWFCMPARRRYTIDAVSRHLGIDESAAKDIALASFTHNFQSFTESALAYKFRLQGNPHLLPCGAYFDRLVRETRPVVVVSAHIGGWELLAGLMPDVKPGAPQAAVVRNQQNKAMNHLIYNMRGSAGGEIVGHRNAAVDVTRVLRQNGTVAFMVDHNPVARTEGIFIDFLGEQASVNIGPAILALRGKAVIYPVFLIRRPNLVYELVGGEPLDTAALQGSIQERAGQIAEFYTRAVEKIVRERPEQWLWMHKRWKTKPE